MTISDQKWQEFIDSRKKRKRVHPPSIIPVILSMSAHIITIGIMLSSTVPVIVPEVVEEAVEYYNSEGVLIDSSSFNIEEVELVEAILE
jgi:hypothetical protein